MIDQPYGCGVSGIARFPTMRTSHAYLPHHGCMGLIFRKSFRLGPFRFNFTKHGFSSWSFRLWRWSWNSKQREHRFDLPGPASWTSGDRRS